MIEHRQIFVNGKWVDSTATEFIDVVNPATEETIATVPRGTAEDVDLAARAAAESFVQWSQSPVEERTAALRRIARILEGRADELTNTMVSEVGTPISAAARAARSTSSAVPRGTDAMVSSVAGLTTGMDSVAVESTHLPLTKICRCSITSAPSETREPARGQLT